MNPVIQTWLDDYACKSKNQYEQALKEILQSITLLSLSRSGFFSHASFYGGTALRIFHGLQRFSEDLDFTLKKPKEDFKLENYFDAIETELMSYDFEVTLSEVKKRNHTNVDSAFLKAESKMHFIKVNIPEEISQSVQHNEFLKIKFEIDTDPATTFESEIQPLLRPMAFSVDVLQLPSLFAGKMHALLFRKWKNRIKGRDFYDLIYYMSRDIPIHLPYLEEKMRKGGTWIEEHPLNREALISLYEERVQQIDFNEAKNDVLAFIKDPRELDLWSTDFFLSFAKKIKVC